MKPRCHRVCVAPTKSDSSLRAFWKGVCVREISRLAFVPFGFGQMDTLKRVWERGLGVMNSKLVSLGVG